MFCVTTQHRYLVYGLLVESELPLSSVHVATAAHGEPDVRIALGSPDEFRELASLDARDPDDWLPHGAWRWRVCMKVDGVFRAIVSRDGRHVICGPVGRCRSQGRRGEFDELVLSAAHPAARALLHRRRYRRPYRLVAKPERAGKSTLAAFLIGCGADLVTDDLLRVTFAGGSMLTYRLSPEAVRGPGKRLLPMPW